MMVPALFLPAQYKLLVYVSQKKHVTSARIEGSFSYTVQMWVWQESHA